MKKLLGVVASLLFLSVALGQNSVQPVNKSLSSNGIYYSLPQTVVHVKLKVKKETFYAGPLADYADDFLGKDDVQTNDKTTYSIAEISLSTSTQPDPKQFFFVEFTPEELKENRHLIMALDEAGMLKGFNTYPPKGNKEQKKSFVTSNATDTDKSGLFHYQAVDPRKEIKDTIIRMITVDTSIKKDIQIKTHYQNKTKEEMAREAAHRIQKIHQDRYYLAIGYQETAYEEGTIKYMDKQLEKRQEEYRALFTGKTVTSFEEYSYDWIPESSSQNKSQTTLCKFSIHSGIRQPNSSIGRPLILQAENEQTTKDIETHATKIMNTNKEKKGIHYRVPDFAQVSVKYDDEKMVSRHMRINQFGIVSFAPWTEEMKFKLHPESGALKYIDLFYRD
ncbi:MAG: DUF4831 family protein [Bacteroidales bacterium]|nr:DUF4831 family protein [Bacteroidales bacterium]MCF8333019.1 DUF4831 family protein [Bacteroidales bacterium]